MLKKAFSFVSWMFTPSEPTVNFLVCPNCDRTWEAQLVNEPLTGDYHYDGEDLCPHGCKDQYGFEVKRHIKSSPIASQ